MEHIENHHSSLKRFTEKRQIFVFHKSLRFVDVFSQRKRF